MKLNRRSFLKGLGLSGLGIVLFRFKPKEDKLPEINIPFDMPMYIHYGIDTASSDNDYSVIYTLSSNSDGTYTYMLVNDA